MPSLVEIIGASIVLKRRGREFTGLCPFHNEKTPSFHVIPDKGFYHCFGCGAHGDAAGWIMQTQNVRYPEAKRILGEPVKPDPAIIAAREARRKRKRAISAYRNHAIDCCLPDWIIAT